MRTLVVSCGGTGSNNALALFQHTGTTNPLGDLALQHGYPTDQVCIAFNPDRVVYVWNDPLLAVLSLWRRGFWRGQHKRLAREDSLSFDRLSQLWTLTLAAGRDVFGIARHAEAWAPHCPQLFDWRREGLAWRAAYHESVTVPEAVRRIYADLDRSIINGCPRRS